MSYTVIEARSFLYETVIIGSSEKNRKVLNLGRISDQSSGFFCLSQIKDLRLDFLSSKQRGLWLPFSLGLLSFQYPGYLDLFIF